MGPMRIAFRFARELPPQFLARVARVQADLYGSLALTGKGHATDRAILLGLAGNEPASIDPAAIESTVAAIRASRQIDLAGAHPIAFDEPRDLVFHRDQMFPPGARTQHPNGLRLTTYDAAGAVLSERTFFSIGGGFIAEDGDSNGASDQSTVQIPYPFHSAAELLEIAHTNSLSIDRVMLANECARIRAIDPGSSAEAAEQKVRIGIEKIWQTMQACVERGIAAEGILPGGLNVRRRAHRLSERLQVEGFGQRSWRSSGSAGLGDGLRDGSERGECGWWPRSDGTHQRRRGRHSCCGPLLSQLHSRLVERRHHPLLPHIRGDWRSLQGERFDQRRGGWMPGGSGCRLLHGCWRDLLQHLAATMARWNTRPKSRMEHNLGMTCDPIGGLVQIPCIERNAMGAAKAVQASRLALNEPEAHKVSLDQVIRTMYLTGLDMQSRYKETSLAGLALNVIEC